MNETLKYIKTSQMRAAMATATLFTCGFFAPVWILWEIFRRRE